jgi:hypothetical protein
MQDIDSSDGIFHDGDPSTNTAGTRVKAAWLNAVQAELAGIVTGNGGTLDPNNNGQVLAILQQYFAPWALEAAAVAYASAGSFTVAGDRSAAYLPNRAIKLSNGATTVKGYVSSSGYSSGTGLTTVQTAAAVPAGLTAVYLGQEIANAPAVAEQVGKLAAFPVSTAPAGWLVCNGTNGGAGYSKTAYPALYSFLKDGGSTCIYGETTDDFYLPDMRGVFLRGWDDGAGNDPDAATRTSRGDGTTGDHVGTKQADAFGSHTHTIPNLWWEAAMGAGQGFQTTGTGNVSATIGADNAGGNETRPKNINVLWCIKY